MIHQHRKEKLENALIQQDTEYCNAELHCQEDRTDHIIRVWNGFKQMMTLLLWLCIVLLSYYTIKQVRVDLADVDPPKKPRLEKQENRSSPITVQTSKDLLPNINDYDETNADDFALELGLACVVCRCVNICDFKFQVSISVQFLTFIVLWRLGYPCCISHAHTSTLPVVFV